MVNAQNFTTKGVEFWAAYGAHANMYKANGDLFANGGSQKMVFYFLSNKPTTVTVEIPSIGWKKIYTVKSGKTTESDEIPKFREKDVRLLEEGVSNKGIHITSTDLITAYCHIYDDKSSATTLLIPVNICGQEYYSLGYSQESADRNGRSYCFVIATEDNTEVEVTPAANTLHHPAGVPFYQKLNKGEVLTLFGDSVRYKDSVYIGSDLSGTYIRTLIQQENEVCKKVIVFSGSTATSIVCKEGSGGNTSDNLIQQVPCIDNWGRYFIAVPTLNMETNRYRAVVLNAQQRVWVNGRLLTNLKNDHFYEFKSNKVTIIRSDSLIAVAQYITSAGQCGNEAAGEKTGDPEMMFLSPTGNGISSTIINSTKHNGIDAHFVNVVMKASDVDSFKLDGQTMPQAFTVLDRNTTYATAQIPVSPGRHVLECDSGFNTYAYGYGKLESYGYNAGFSTKSLGGSLGVRNPYKSLYSTTTTCTATPFKFYFDVEVKLLSLLCKFNLNSNLSPNNDVWITDLRPDSIFKDDSTRKIFYRYFLPDFYQYSVAEQLPVQLTAYYPDVKGCIVKKQFSFLIDIIQKPIAGMHKQYDKCGNGFASFYDSSLSFGNSQLIDWEWKFGDGQTAAERNPLHQFEYGEYNVQMRTINDVGCYADTSELVGRYHKPVPAFTVSGTHCNKQDIIFKGTATIQGDGLQELKWIFPDRTTALAQNVIKQFADSGDYDVKFTAMSSHGCSDTVLQAVHIYKTPEINLPPVLYVPAGDTLRLRPVYKGNIRSYNWAPATYLSSPLTPDPVASVTNEITYSITAIAAEAPCQATAITTVKIQKKLYIPSAFTPNGDGLNDTWRIINIEGYVNPTVEIYDRWGKRIFYSRGYPTPWNGTLNNQPLSTGTYLYIIRTSDGQKNNVQSGSVTLIR